MQSNLAPRMELAVVESDDGLAAVAHPDRRALLQALAEAPDSASGLAERMDDTRQRVNYHLRALEEAGLVEVAERRQRRGFEEKVYRPVGRSFALDPAVLGSLDAGAVIRDGDRWASGYALALASRTTRELAALRTKAAAEEKRLAVASLDSSLRLATPKAMEAFVDDLARSIAEVVARHHDPTEGARPFRVTACSHPAPPGADAQEER